MAAVQCAEQSDIVSLNAAAAHTLVPEEREAIKG